MKQGKQKWGKKTICEGREDHDDMGTDIRDAGTKDETRGNRDEWRGVRDVMEIEWI